MLVGQEKVEFHLVIQLKSACLCLVRVEAGLVHEDIWNLLLDHLGKVMLTFVEKLFVVRSFKPRASLAVFDCFSGVLKSAEANYTFATILKHFEVGI